MSFELGATLTCQLNSWKAGVDHNQHNKETPAIVNGSKGNKQVRYNSASRLVLPANASVYLIDLLNTCLNMYVIASIAASECTFVKIILGP